MKIVFMGTPEPAAQILEDLQKTQHKIICVVTQPDRKKGRGQKIVFSEVKEAALKYGLPLEQPEKVKSNAVFASFLKSIKPDIVIVVAYGKILPKEILDIPKYGCINVHASLLPKYRGAAPIQWALLKGEKETGITIMKLDRQLDTGDIIFQEKVKIAEEDDAPSLSKKLFAIGSKLLLLALEQIENKKVKSVPQDESQATYAPSLTKESGELDWRKTAEEIHNRVRAMVPWPGANTFYNKKILKIWKTKVVQINLATKFSEPGTIIEITKNLGFIVAAGSGNILILEVQPEGKKRISAYNFVLGYDVKIGDVLPK
ncbi:MAG: methionyl-tRNA formyltransferase [Candidatus Saganbacteria bacterium]|nr:methionyl-tRNA formyltransferase [Candidatus Saganbacteria bacterium]